MRRGAGRPGATAWRPASSSCSPAGRQAVLQYERRLQLHCPPQRGVVFTALQTLRGRSRNIEVPEHQSRLHTPQGTGLNAEP